MKNKNNRIECIDGLRGFALLGILWVNIYVFNAPYAYYSEFYGAFVGWDELLVFFSSSFVAGKFMFIFSFLFGYGAQLQYSNMDNKIIFGNFWRRRMVGLAVFGLLHLLFFWFGDILLPYALLGFLVPLLLKQKVKHLIGLGFVFYFSSAAVVLSEKVLEFGPLSIGSDLSLDQFIKIYSSSSFTKLFPYRMEEFWSLKNEKLAFYLPKEMALFCLGIAAGKLKALEIYKPKLGYLLLGIILSIMWYVFRVSYFDLFQPDKNPLVIPLLIAQNILFEIILSMSYILGFSYLFKKQIFKPVLSNFVSVGRMSLTNYFVQSAICVLLFYGYGLGNYGSFAPKQLLLATLVIFITQVVFSKLWLSYFEQGPLESLWRKWSYKK